MSPATVPQEVTPSRTSPAVESAESRRARVLLDTLDLQLGSCVALAGVTDPELVRAIVQARIEPFDAEAGADFDRVVVQAERLRHLGQVGVAASSIAPDGAVWVLWPKGRLDICQGDVRRAGRDAGLVDVKLADLTERLHAMKFVHRPETDRAAG